MSVTGAVVKMLWIFKKDQQVHG